MKRILFSQLLVVVLVAFAAMACSQYPGFDKTETGLYYKFHVKSGGEVKPVVGDWIKLNMVYRTKDSLLFESNKAMNGQPLFFQLQKSEYPGDIYEAFTLMSAGDSATFILNADSLFIKTFKAGQRPPFIDSNSVVYFDIKMIEVSKKDQMMQKEKEQLTKFITDNNIVVQPLPSGLYYIEQAKGTGKKVDSTDWIDIHMTVSLIDGKKLWSTMDRGQVTTFQYGRQQFENKGALEGISMMNEGGKARLIVPSQIGFFEMGRGAMIPPYSTLVYDMDLVKVKTQAQHDKELEVQKKEKEAKMEKAKTEEMSKLDKYLKDNKITAKPTASGLYYIETQNGTGAQAMAGKKVKVHYTGTLLDGTKFDSSRDRGQPFEFNLGQGQVIKGWDEGIALMKAGGKAKLIIPSKIAYGDRDMGTIPSYSTLVFDVELIEVK